MKQFSSSFKIKTYRQIGRLETDSTRFASLFRLGCDMHGNVNMEGCLFGGSILLYRYIRMLIGLIKAIVDLNIFTGHLSLQKIDQSLLRLADYYPAVNFSKKSVGGELL